MHARTTLLHTLFYVVTAQALSSAPAIAQDPPPAAPVAAPAAAAPAVAAPSAVTAPPPPEPEPEPEPTTGYDKGFFVRSSDDAFKLVIQGRVQPRFTLVSIEGERDQAQFSIARARLTLGGHAFTPDLTYKFQSDFGKGQVSLKDFYADYRAWAGVLHLRVGQYKRPFSRQQITSSGSLELVERASTDKAFGAGRDIGVMIHDDYESSPQLEYAFGIFNGTGEKPRLSGDVTVDSATGEGEITQGELSNVPLLFDPALVLRVGYNHGGPKGYSEADLEGGPLRFGVAASGFLRADADDDDDSQLLAELDFVLKLHGFSSTGGVYAASGQNGTSFGDRVHDASGAHVQLGYVIGGFLQPVVRYAIVAPKGPGTQHEARIGVSYYAFKHNVKWQTDVGPVTDTGADTTDVEARTQLQVGF